MINGSDVEELWGENNSFSLAQKQSIYSEMTVLADI